MKIAVTGAGGFIGTHVLRALAAEPAVELVAVSRRPDVQVPERVRVVALDIERPPKDPWRALGCPDLLVHLAWSGLPNYGSRHHFESCLPHQYAFLRALVEEGLPSLLATGTCFEYGDASGELTETLPAAPRNPYAFAKDALRRQLEFLRADHPFRFTWARLFYMHGEGQPPGSLYGQFRAALARGDASFPMSPGDQLRDYLPVTEVARLLAALALASPDAGVVNVCSGRPRSVRSVVEGWLREEGRTMALELGRYPYAAHEPLAFWGSNRRLQEVLAQGGPAVRMDTRRAS